MKRSKNKKTYSRVFCFFMTAILVISIIDKICKLFTKELHVIQIVWGCFIGIDLLLWVFFFKRWKTFKIKDNWQTNTSNSTPCFLICSISSLYVGLTYLPLAEATAIGFVAPLFITILSVPILKKKVSIYRWIAILIGFTGVKVIIRPGGEFWQFVSIVPLLGAIFFVLFQIFTRLLSRTEKTFTTLFYAGLGGLG